jgi:hypothetical protein
MSQEVPKDVNDESTVVRTIRFLHSSMTGLTHNARLDRVLQLQKNPAWRHTRLFIRY